MVFLDLMMPEYYTYSDSELGALSFHSSQGIPEWVQKDKRTWLIVMKFIVIILLNYLEVSEIII